MKQLNKRGNIYLIALFAFVVVMAVLASTDYISLSVLHADTGLRVVTTEVRLNDTADEVGGIIVEYSIGAARSEKDLSQAMIMFVKVNDEWLSVDALAVRDRSAYVKTVSIPRAELLDGRNVVEFYFKSDRTHSDDTTEYDCYVTADRSDRREYRVDDDVGAWTAALVGGEVVYEPFPDGVVNQYGTLCGFFPQGRYHTGAMLNVPVYIARSSNARPDNPDFSGKTLRTLMDEKVNKTTYSYERETIRLPAIPCEVTDTCPPPPPVPCEETDTCPKDPFFLVRWWQWFAGLF